MKENEENVRNDINEKERKWNGMKGISMKHQCGAGVWMK
jgi:hypothetical protein